MQDGFPAMFCPPSSLSVCGSKAAYPIELTAGRVSARDTWSAGAIAASDLRGLSGTIKAAPIPATPRHASASQMARARCSNWIHEIKHDGFRLMARRDPVGIRLITRKGNDWTTRYPLVAEAVNHLRVRSCLIDGQVVCFDDKGVTAF